MKLSLISQKEVEQLEVIHYGSKQYIPEHVKPITDIGFVKPEGGLWTSPVNSSNSWKDWCHNGDFGICEESNSFRLKFKSNTRIYKIDSKSDLSALTFYQPYLSSSMRFLHYRYLTQFIDALWLTDKGQQDTAFLEGGLYGWDCESVLILNPHCCYQSSPVLITI